MSEQEMNSYRFTSGQEPSDEMLSQLMKEVATDAKNRQEQATDAYFSEMRREAEVVKAKWADRINKAING
ncbi:MAG: hypothetical protein K2H32_00180 [Muribaculaceae bacterium]|nr:hypothetical protein [Muribaculaceae bacterium]MDE5845097.1 hypothetical protein [Muribaculaceae bacterium]MDE5856771.1 hypothetical protein [Muribaculaceae bacterium]MDE7092947.1 hypothetical protein [Muribaculaceae bacterium]MDE7155802.1 hypothetical protein [Muribaculaceae bacterium]